MNDIDTRIVEMEFDSSKFDKRIAKSHKTLDDFKQALNFEETAKGLEKFTQTINSINFGIIENGVQALVDKFTGLGTTTEYVFSRIRNTVEGTLRQIEYFIDSISLAQIGVGEGKYDALNKAVQTIIADGKITEDQAYGVMERLMAYTDQTSYNFTNMVGQVAAFRSTGRGLAESEQVVEGIANAAARAGQGVMNADVAMQVFSKSMATGYVNLEKFTSLAQTAKIVNSDFRKTLIDTAVAVGTLEKKGDKYFTKVKGSKKTEVKAEQLEQTLNKKWFTNDVIMALGKKYYFEKLTGATEEELSSFAGIAYKSAQRALTLTDAINAIKESVSSGWMQSFRFIFGDINDAMENFTNLADSVIDRLEKIGEWRNAVLESWSSNGGRDNLFSALFGDFGTESKREAFGLIDILGSIGEMISDAISNVIYLFSGPEIRNQWTNSSLFRNTDGPAAAMSMLIGDLTKNVKDFTNSVYNFFNEEVNFGGRTTTRLNLIREALDGLLSVIAFGFMVLNEAIGLVGRIAKKLEPSLAIIQLLFASIGSSIYDAIAEITGNDSIESYFTSLAESFNPFTDAVNKLVASIATLIAKFINWGNESGTFAAIGRFVSDAVKTIGEAISKYGTPIIDFFTETFGAIGDVISQGFSKDSIEAAIPKIVDSFKTMMSRITKEITGGSDDIIAWGKGVIKNIVDAVLGFIESKGFDTTGLRNAISFVSDVFETLGSIVKKIGKPVLDFFKDFAKAVGKIVTSGFTKQSFIDAWESIKTSFTKMIGDIGTNFGGELLDIQFVDSIKHLLGLDDPNSILSQIVGVIKTVFGALGDFIGQLTEGYSIVDIIKGGFGFKKIRGWIHNLWQFISATDIVGIITKLGKIFLAIEAVRTVSNIRKSIQNFRWGIEEIAQSFATGFRIRFDDYGEYYLKMAEAVAVLVILAGVIGNVPEDKLLKGVVVVGIMMTLMWAFERLTRVGTNLRPQSLGVQFLEIMKVLVLGMSLMGLVLAVGLMGLMLIPLIKTENGVIQAITFVGSIIMMLAIFMQVLKQNQLQTLQIAGLAAFAFALATLALALVPVAKLNLDQILNGLLAFGGIIGIITLMMYVIQQMRFDSVKIAGLGVFVFALVALGLSLIPLSSLNTDQIFNGLIAMAGVVGIISLMMYIIQKMHFDSVKIVGLAGFAFAMAVLALTLIPLSNISTDGMYVALEGFLGIIAGLSLLMLVIKKLEIDTVKITGIIGFAFSMAILALTLVPLSMIPTDGMYVALEGFLGIIAGLSLLMLVIKKLEIDTVKITGLIGFAFAMAILALTLIPLSAMSPEQMYVALEGYLGIIAGLSILMLVMKRMEVDTVKIAGIVGFAISLFIIVNALLPLASLQPEQLISMLVGFAVMTAGLIFLLDTLKSLENSIIKSVVTVVALMFLIDTFAVSLRKVKDIDPWVMVAFGVGLGAVIWAISEAVSKLSRPEVGILGAIKAIAIIAVAIAAVIGVLTWLAPMLVNSIMNSLQSAMSRLLSVSEIMIRVSDNFKAVDETGIDKAKELFGKIGGLFESMSGFGKYYGKITLFTTSMFDLSSSLTTFQSFTEKIDDPSKSKAFATIDKILEYGDKLTGFTIGSFSTNVYSFGNSLRVFNDNTSNIMDADSNNGLKLATKLSDLKDSLTGFTIGWFGASTFGLGSALHTFQMNTSDIQNPEDMNAFKMIDKILGYTTLNTFSSGGFGAAVFSMGSALATFDFLAGNVKYGDNSPAVLLLKDLTGCADDINKISEMKLSAFKENVAGLGGALSIYATGVKEATGLEIGDTPDVSGAVRILQAISTSLADPENQFELPELPDQERSTSFGADLAALAIALSKFVEASQGFGSQTDKALEALSFFKDLRTDLTPSNIETANAFNHAGVHESVLTEFGTDITALGNAMVVFVAGANNIDDSKMKIALSSLTAFADLRDRIQSNNIGDLDVVETFDNAGIHASAIDVFANDITSVGTAVGNFATDVKVIEEGKFNFALASLDYFIQLRNKINDPNFDLGVVHTVEDANVTPSRMDRFAEGIVALSGAVWQFATDTKIIDSGKMQAGLDALDFFYKLKTKLDDDSFDVSFTKDIADDENLTQDNMTRFGNNISHLGNALAQFAESTEFTGGRKITFDNAIGALQTLTEMQAKLPNVGGALSWFTGYHQTLDQLGGEISAIGINLNSFAGSVSENYSGDNTEAITAALTALDSLTSIFANMSNVDEGRIMAAGSYAGYLSQFIHGLTSQLTNVDGQEIPVIAEEIGSLMEAVSSEVSSWEDAINLDALQGFKFMAEAIQALASADNSIDFENIGVSIATGVAAGITKSTNIVTLSAEAMAVAAYNAAMNKLNAHSPSKVFIDVGSYIGAGMAIGINNTAGDVTKSAEGLSDSAIETTGGMMAEISRIMAENSDANPTITPVLDMTNINAGIAAMNREFEGKRYGIDVDTSTDFASSVYGRSQEASENQNGTDLSGIYERMSTLNEQLDNLGTRIASMRLVLDTGAVAGGVTDAIDINLGRKQFYAGRNN